MNLSIFLFLIGILGFILNRKNIILMIIAIEIMLLAVTLLILISSFSFDDTVGQTFSIYIISIAGAESVIGLSILVAFYRSSSFVTSIFSLIKYILFSNLKYKIIYSIIRSRFISMSQKHCILPLAKNDEWKPTELKLGE
jgi:NADH-ubiquinone oxidoreductase chain 4L